MVVKFRFSAGPVNIGLKLVYPEGYEIGMPNLGYDLKWTLAFEWCMVGFVSKNNHQKDIVLRVQNFSTILDIIVNIIEKGGGGI